MGQTDDQAQVKRKLTNKNICLMKLPSNLSAGKDTGK